MLKSRVLILGCLVWIAAFAVAHAQSGRPEVVLLRGGAGYWPGARILADELSKYGFEPKIIIGALYPIEASRIATQYHAGQRCGPVTIVGYSSGADYACRLSSNLGARGVPVTTLVLIESTMGVPVPGNVEFCLNLYESRPKTDWIPVFRGVAVEAEGTNTELLNLDVKQNAELNWLSEYSHFTMASNAESRALVRNLLLLRHSQFQQQLQPSQQPLTIPVQTLPPAPSPQMDLSPPEPQSLPPSPLTQFPDLHQEPLAIPVSLKR